MTLCKISIPFDTRKQYGTVNIPVLSKEQFVENASRINAVSSSIFNKAKYIIHGPGIASCLLFPNRTHLSHFTSLQNGGLKIVKSDKMIWLGFIPFFKPNAQEEEDYSVSKMNVFWHYRLGDFSPPFKRAKTQASTACLFYLPSRFQLSQVSSDQYCSISNLSFLLLFHQGKCALVCCEGPLPAVSRVPIFCCKKIKSGDKNFQSIKTGKLAVPFLMGKKSGIFYVPICSSDQWIKNQKETPCQKKELIKHNNISWNSILFILPMCVTFDAILGLQGLDCCILQSQYGWEIGFFPKKNSDKQNYSRFLNFQRALLDPVPQQSVNCYISGNGCSSIVLDNSICLRAKESSDIVKLKGGSFFLLASEDGHLCGLLCRKGNFKLKCVRPTNPEEGIFSIDKLLEQSFSESSSAKKARIEERGESSRSAMEEFRRAQVKEQEESSEKVDKALKEAEKELKEAEKELKEAEKELKEAKKELKEAEKELIEEEEKIAGAEALMFFQHQQKPK